MHQLDSSLPRLPLAEIAREVTSLIQAKMSAPSGAAATNGSELPYGGDVQAAAKAQDREAIRTIMAWRTAKERGEAPPAAPAPAPAEALAAAAAAAPTRRSLSDLVAEQDERAPPPPSILGNKDGWAASEPAPPATIDKLQATLAAEVAKKEMASEDAPAAEGGMAAHDKAAGRAPPPPPPQVDTRDASKETVDVTCKPCKSPLLEGVSTEDNEEDAAAAYAKAKAKGDAASEAANAANEARKALEKPKPLTGEAAKKAYRASLEARQKAAKKPEKKKEKKVPTQCPSRGRRDGVFTRPRRVDAVVTIARDSTRDDVGPRAGEEGQEGRQGPRHTRRRHPIHGHRPQAHPGHGTSPVEPPERLLQGPSSNNKEGLRRGPVDRY